MAADTGERGDGGTKERQSVWLLATVTWTMVGRMRMKMQSFWPLMPVHVERWHKGKAIRLVTGDGDVDHSGQDEVACGPRYVPAQEAHLRTWIFQGKGECG